MVEERSKRDRIARLRKRVAEANTVEKLRAVLAGLFDLLDDEL
jgi:hypothetical protein